MDVWEQIETIISRIAEGKHSEDDLTKLRQLLNSDKSDRLIQVGKNIVGRIDGQEIQIGDRLFMGWNDKAIEALVEQYKYLNLTEVCRDREAVFEFGKYNVNVGKGTGLEIGDRFYLELTSTAIQSLINSIQSLSISDKQAEQTLEEEREEELQEIDFDINSIKLINSRLKAVEEIRKVGQLYEKEEKDFNALKNQVNYLILINQDLKKLAKQANNLLSRSLQYLEKRLEEINLSGQELIGDSQDRDYNDKIELIKRQIEILKRFEANLEAGREASAWLGENINRLTKNAGKYALNQHPKITSTASKKQIDDFYFSIKQFLEQVIYCLFWGVISILDSPEIPLVFEINVYQVVFERIKIMLPSRLSKDVTDQIKYYLNYIIESLEIY